MPTSSQARILTQDENLAVHPFLRQRSKSEGTALPIPCINLQASFVSYTPAIEQSSSLHCSPEHYANTPSWLTGRKTNCVPLPKLAYSQKTVSPRLVSIGAMPKLCSKPVNRDRFGVPHSDELLGLPSPMSQTQNTQHCQHLGSDMAQHCQHLGSDMAQNPNTKESSRQQYQCGDSDAIHNCNECTSLVTPMIRENAQQKEDLQQTLKASASSAISIGDVQPAASVKQLYRQLLNLGFSSRSFRGLNSDSSSTNSEDEKDHGPVRFIKREKGKCGSRTKELSQRYPSSQQSLPAIRTFTGKTIQSKSKVSDNYVVSHTMDKEMMKKDQADANEISDCTQKPSEVKLTHIPMMRLRKILPPAEPTLLCFRCPRIRLTHAEVCALLEQQTGAKVHVLQFEPEYLHCWRDGMEPRVVWVFQMQDLATHETLLAHGVTLSSKERLRVRSRDDVFQEEHRAHTLVQQIREEHMRRSIVDNTKGANRSKRDQPLSFGGLNGSGTF